MKAHRILRRGAPFIWLTGGALATSLLMIGGLLFLILTRAFGFFWPADVMEARLSDGSVVLGQLRAEQAVPGQPGQHRVQLQVGNRDVYGQDFRWIDEARIASTAYPPAAVVVERTEWGNLYGYVQEVRRGDSVVATGADEGWAKLAEMLPAAWKLVGRIDKIEHGRIARINYRMERARLALKRIDREGGGPSKRKDIEEKISSLDSEYADAQRELHELTAAGGEARVIMRLAEGQTKDLPLVAVVRAYRPNAMTNLEKAAVYAAKFWEFVSGDPRESNTEGGVFPAIFGTVLMVLIMSVAVVPFGVLAALYLREYARQGILVRTVRIAVNNLAGVPSIVFGVFGLGFFVYFVGGGIDQLFFSERLPSPTFGTGGILWAALTLALLTVPVAVVATEEGLAAVPRENREGSLALGATQFETIWRVVLPHALPGILTGLILAMARGAGEVAPLMITGVVKLAPSMPLDWNWPFLHLERKFMHLGFHIYDVGFQSPNVEAAKPMVYVTTLLLVAIVVSLNLTAILIRSRLRRRFAGGVF